MKNFASEKMLKNLSIFSALSADELHVLCELITLVKFAPEAQILQQGHIGKGLYILKKGHVRITVMMPGDKAMQLALLHAGNFFGEVTLLDSGPVSASVYAVQETGCYFLSAENYRALYLLRPDITYKINQQIVLKTCERLRAINQQIMDNLSIFNELISPLENKNKDKNKQKNSIQQSGVVKIALPALHAKGMTSAYLQKLDLFNHLDTEDLRALLKYAQQIEVKKGKYLYHKGDHLNGYYIVIEGCIQAFLFAHHHAAKVKVSAPGDAVGYAAYIEGSVAIDTAVAREDTLLLQFDRADMQTLEQKNSRLFYKFSYGLHQQLVARLRSANRNIARVISANKKIKNT